MLPVWTLPVFCQRFKNFFLFNNAVIKPVFRNRTVHCDYYGLYQDQGLAPFSGDFQDVNKN